MAIINSIYFEHAKTLIAAKIDTTTLTIIELKTHEIEYKKQTTIDEYEREFAWLADWLRLNPLDTVFSGPRLGGDQLRTIKGRQNHHHDPANDSKAFMKVLEPFTQHVSRKDPVTLSNNEKAILEVVFNAPGSSELLYCIIIGLYTVQTGKKLGYSQLAQSLSKTAVYKTKQEFIKTILPESQTKRIAGAALKNAIQAWDKPTARAKEYRDSLKEAQLTEVLEFIEGYRRVLSLR